FDIATIVQGTMREKQRVRQPQGSIIDKLIEEALLEFTSLQDDKGGPAASQKADQPLKLAGFEDIGKWADEIAVTNAPTDDIVRNSLPMGAFEEGNLAALEEDDLMPASAAAPAVAPASAVPAEKAAASPAKRPLSVAPSAQVAPFAAAGKTGDDDASDVPAPAAGGSAVKALLLVAVLGALAAGAWFGGLIPH
ncbi:MAG TPA: hypothetical protein VHB21_13820, partial [Minicystis sp.]|nr:hypothetical protein [Minicystis sp.]